MCRGALGVCCALLFLFSRLLWANDPDFSVVEEAKQHFRDGMQYFDAKQYEDAVVEFRAAYKLKPTWKLQYNIAQAEAAAKRYGLALEEFEAYLSKGGDEVLVDREKEVLREIDRLRMLVGILEVKAQPGTEIYVDSILRGTMPLKGILRIAVGEHNIELRDGNRLIYSGSVTIAGGFRTQLDAEGMAAGDMEQASLAGVPSQWDNVTAVETTVPDGFVAATDSGDESVGNKRFRLSEENKQKVLFIGSIAGMGVGTGIICMGIGFTAAASKAAEKRDLYADAYNADPSREDYLQYARTKQAEVDTHQRQMVVSYVLGGLIAAGGGVGMFFWNKHRKGKKAEMLPFSGGLQVHF